jgi:hypothetical protein
MLGPVDGALLQFYIATVHADCFYVADINDPGWGWHSEPLGYDVFQRFGPTLSSMAVRNAVLLLSLRNGLGQDNNDLLEMEYKDRFYGAMRKAISAHAYIDVLYASYFACFAALLDLKRRSSSVYNFIRHLKGFVSVLITVAPVCTPTELLSAWILFTHIIYTTAIFQEWTRFSITASENLKQLFETAFILLNSASRSGLQDWHSTSGLCLELLTGDFRRRAPVFWYVRLGRGYYRIIASSSVTASRNLCILQLSEGH